MQRAMGGPSEKLIDPAMPFDRDPRTIIISMLPFVRAQLLRKATDSQPNQGTLGKLYCISWCVLSLLVGRAPKTTFQLISVSQRWTAGKLSHNEATASTTACVNTLLPTVRTDREAGELRRYLTSIGLFTASIPLLPRSSERGRYIKRTDWERECRRAIASSDATYAQELSIKKPSVSPNRVIEAYLDLWLNPPEVQNFKHCVSGPAPKPAVSDEPFMSNLTRSEVLMPRLPNPHLEERGVVPEGGIVYANGMTMAWFRTLDQVQRSAVLKRSGELRVKKLDEWMLKHPEITNAIDIRPLYLHGSPNMIPIMIIDLLVRDYSCVYVTGSSFFLGQSPYGPGNRRYLIEKTQVTDEFGGTGREFERCHAISSHDQIVNRALVRNLVDTGWVAGDEMFTQAVLMDNHEYLHALDHHYGPSRR